MRPLRLLLLAALAAVVVGCGPSTLPGVETVCEPGMTDEPCASGVEDGAPYSYRLLTHCGIEWAYFDGRYWVPRPKVSAPSDWTPIVEGTMTLEGRRAAVFESGSETIRFVPAAHSFRPAPCA